MSLEEAIKANTAAVEANTEAFEKLAVMLETLGDANAKTPANKKAGKDPAKETKGKSADAEEEQAEEEADESMFGDEEITLKDLQGLLKDLVAASDGDKSTAKKLLDKFKVKKIPDLPEEDYAEFKRACEKQIAALSEEE